MCKMEKVSEEFPFSSVDMKCHAALSTAAGGSLLTLSFTLFILEPTWNGASSKIDLWNTLKLSFQLCLYSAKSQQHLTSMRFFL